MDSRSLRELGLLDVTRLYGMDRRAAPAAMAVTGLHAVPVQGGEWLFVGAGADGEGPFEGAAGRLLDGMLAAIGCRRGGEVRSLEACLERAAPKIMVALGPASASRLLGAEAELQALRGKVHRFRDTPVVVTCDPVELLGAPAGKARAWEDLVFARRTLAGA